MDKLLWRLLLWIWIRRARKQFGGLDWFGDRFSTGGIQTAIRQTTGQQVHAETVYGWLIERGFIPGAGGCRWHRKCRVR